MEYNDYELVYLAQEHNEIAIDILHEKYNSIIQNKSKKIFNFFSNKSLELNDILQEALIAFDDAIMSYNQNDNALFYTFANMCIERRLMTFFKSQTRNKYNILNKAINCDFEDENNFGLYNLIRNNINPESKLINKEKFSNLYNSIQDELTDNEFEIFKLRLQGANCQEIAKKLNIDCKVVYNCVDRIRKKIIKVLKLNNFYQ